MLCLASDLTMKETTVSHWKAAIFDLDLFSAMLQTAVTLTVLAGFDSAKIQPCCASGERGRRVPLEGLTGAGKVVKRGGEGRGRRGRRRGGMRRHL